MPITFDRTICCNFDETISREWFITNGLGGYAAGTVAGTLTRMQQGLLVAALEEDATPQLLLAKIDEEVLFDQRTYYLGTNEYRDGTLNPSGFVHLEAFRLEEGLPVFTYRLGGVEGVMLEKRIWMPQGQNTTCIQYRVLRTSAATQSASAAQGWRTTAARSYPGPLRSYNVHSAEAAPTFLTLTLLPLMAHRPYNQLQHSSHEDYFRVRPYQTHEETPGENEDELTLPRGCAGCSIETWDHKTPCHMLCIGHTESHTQFIPTGVWYWNFLHRHDQAAGLPASSDLYLPGVIRARLWPDKDSSLTIIVTTEDFSSLPFTQKQADQAYEQALDYQRGAFQGQSYFGEGGGSIRTYPVLPFASATSSAIQSEEFPRLLYQAGDRLLIQRTLPYQERSNKAEFFFRASEHIPTITPGYYDQADNTRETLIALPGLTLATRRYSEAQRLLRHIGRTFRQGLLPTRLPSAGLPRPEDTDYASVDTTLWYFYALDKYLEATRDYELLDELYPRLAESLNCYTQGTTHGIQADPRDGLLRTSSSLPLTWMDAIYQGQPVTPRAGKTVEVNALWYHALSLMHEWSRVLYQRGRINYTREYFAEQAELCRRGFNERFWYTEGGHLYDVLDGPDGPDASLRPNQLLACSLRHAVLETDRQAAVLEQCTRHLLTPYGLRSLAPGNPAYRGHLPALQQELPAALHQGAAWSWLIGPYIDTMLKVGQTPEENLAPYQEYVWRKGLQVLEPFRQHMQTDMLGHISGVYSGNAPHRSGPRLASATGSGELLRIYSVLAHMGIQHPDQALSV